MGDVITINQEGWAYLGILKDNIRFYTEVHPEPEFRAARTKYRNAFANKVKQSTCFS